ncbi:Uncharacterised protein [Vibrio cholerae]|nr:Uncharacterised protein [Vibrio cholerae]
MVKSLMTIDKIIGDMAVTTAWRRSMYHFTSTFLTKKEAY